MSAFAIQSQSTRGRASNSLRKQQYLSVITPTEVHTSRPKSRSPMKMSRIEGSGSGEQPAVRTRKSNGKSRLGCMACKQKRIKCDELRPTCTKCRNSSQACVYPTNEVPKWKSSVSTFSFSSTPEPTQSSSQSSSPANITGTEFAEPLSYSGYEENTPIEYDNSFFDNFDFGQDLSPVPAEQSRVFETHDVLLLMHFTSTTSLDLIGSQQLWTEHTMQLAFQHNFLMHAILALSARHLQKVPSSLTSGPESDPDYRALEAYHHQEALTAFRASFHDTVHLNPDAVLAASFILSFHACSILDFKPTAIIPAEDTSFTFLRGIRTIVGDRPEVAQSGRFQALIEPRFFLPSVPPTLGPGAQLMNLLNNLPSTYPSVFHHDTYVERIESLTLYMATSTSDGLESSVLEELLSCFLRWQSTCPVEYVELVKDLDTIALVILAHYYAAAAYLLSRNRGKWWWWHEKPAYMVETIADYLGIGWEDWMEWPINVIRSVGPLGAY